MNQKVDWELLLKYLQNTCNENEKKGFVQWLGEDNSHQTFFDVVKLTWIETGNIHDYFMPYMNKNNELSETDHSEDKKSKATFVRLITIIAVIAVVIGVVLYFLYTELATVKTHLVDVKTTAHEKPHEILLADGSKVWLNSNSRLVFPEDFIEKYRLIELYGQAYFEVAYNPSKPFVVKSQQIKVTVLGTSFHISSDTILHSISLQVMNGKVLFESSKDKMVLASNEKAVYSMLTDSIQLELEVDLNVLAWKTGVIYFEEESLDVILCYLSDYYNCELILSNSELSRLKLTATFDNNSLAEVLSEIENNLGLRFLKEGDVYTCYK